MIIKQVKLKFTLNVISGEYIGGAEGFINDLKETILTLTKSDGFSLSGSAEDKFTIKSDTVQRLNQLKKVYIENMEHAQIGLLSVDFLDVDNVVYNVPDNADLESDTVEIMFQTPVPSYTEINVYQQNAWLHSSVTQTNMPGSEDSKYVYSKDGDTDPSGWSQDNLYYWDFSKRYEFGEYENGDWVAYPQSLADMPASTTSDISQYKMILTPYGTNLMYYGFNYFTGGGDLGSREFTCRIYDDTYSAWQNSDHSDSYPSSEGVVTDIPYDSTKIYKILYMLNASGIPVNFTDLCDVVFSESSGFINISISGGGTSEQFAKFVFYARQLPTVTKVGIFGDNNWLSTSSGSAESISDGGTSSNLEYDVSGTSVSPNYDSSKSYGIIQWQETEGTTAGRTEFNIINSNGKFKVENNTDSSLNFYRSQVAVCSSSDATVITVYDSNNVEYNAFRNLIDDIYYYYVLDGIQTDWLVDLSGIGYSLTPTLPTVDTTNNGYNRLRFKKNGDNYTFSVGYATSVYSDSSPYYDVDWDSTKVYGVIKYWNYDQSQIGRQGITPIEAPSWGTAGKVYMKNDSGSELTVAKIRVATCDDLSATVVTVYDSNNVAYNAFKFNLNNTDYYYVLDEVQTDWADDLSSIGYSVNPTPSGSYIEVTVLLTQSSTVTFDANDFWSGIVPSESSAYQDLLDFGVNLETGVDYRISSNNPDFTFEPLGLFNGSTDLQADMSNFYCAPGASTISQYENYMCIWSRAAYNTPADKWKCKITKNT